MVVEVVPEPQAAVDRLVSGQVGGGLIDELLVAPLAEQLEPLLPDGDRLTVVPSQAEEGVVDDALIEQVRAAPDLGGEVGALQTQLSDQLQPPPLVVPEAVARP